MRACQPKDLTRREWRSMLGRQREGEGEREKEHAQAGEKDSERGREKERMHAGERERERASKRASKALAPPLMFFLPLGVPYSNWA